MNLSFAGCGFLGIYHVGVSVCFRKYAPHLLLDKISGASAGAISACCLLCDLPLGEITSDVLRLVTEARSGSLGPFSPSFSVQAVLLDGLAKFLPEDAHLRVSGKLHISLTRVYDGKNVIVSHFTSKEDLLQALLASCFIPVFSGLLPPKFHGIRYMDGGFSDNLPVLDENTITVSPFCGESDICPRDLSSQLFHVNVANTSIELSKQNIGRFARILFPPKPEVLSNMCKQGFDDALRFLHRNNLISCTRCLAVQSTFQIQESLDDTLDYDPECLECKHHRQEALVADLPDTVMTVFQNAIESANKGLVNWLFQHRSMRLLSLPCMLPVDIVYATFTNIAGEMLESRSLKYEVLGSVLTFRRGCSAHPSIHRRLLACRPKLRHSLRSVCAALLRQARGAVGAAQRGSSRSSYQPPPGALVRGKRSHSSVSRLGTELEVAVAVAGGTEAAAALAAAEDDTFEQILRVTDHHDALMAFYYMDDNNKVKVTEIYDVTDAEAETLQSPAEREANKNLEFDNDWADDQINLYDNELEGMSEVALEDLIQKTSIFSDPESEWSRSKSPGCESDEGSDPDWEAADRGSDRPESDQPPARRML